MNKVVLYKKTEEILELMQIKTGKNKAVLVNEIIQNFHKPDTIPVIFYVPEESVDNLEEWFSDRASIVIPQIKKKQGESIAITPTN